MARRRGKIISALVGLLLNTSAQRMSSEKSLIYTPKQFWICTARLLW
jgi:hypothetical protein